MSNEVYTVGHVKEMMMAQYGVKKAAWYYHEAKMPQPDTTYGGWPFYSAARIDEVRAYWLRQSSVKRFMKNNAHTFGA